MSSFIERTNAKRIAQGLEPIPPLNMPPRKPYVFVLEEFIAKIHTFAPLPSASWDSPKGLKHLEMICREMGFRGTTEEFTAIFYSIHPDSLARLQVGDLAIGNSN